MCGEGAGVLLPTPRGVSRIVAGSLPPSPGHFATSRRKVEVDGVGNGGLGGEGEGKENRGLEGNSGQIQRRFSFRSDHSGDSFIIQSVIEEGRNGGRTMNLESAEQGYDVIAKNVPDKGVHESRNRGRFEMELRKEGSVPKMLDSPIRKSSQFNSDGSLLTDYEVTSVDNLLKTSNAQIKEIGISTDTKIGGVQGSAYLAGAITSLPESNTVITVEISPGEKNSNIHQVRERIPSLSNSCLVR